MTTKELLACYYEGLAKKKGWENALSEDFLFTGGDMLKAEPIVGKAAYIGVIGRFSRVFADVRTITTIVDGDLAYVTANYDFVFPGGRAVNGNVAEIWTVKNGKLAALTIFFDTLVFSQLTANK